MRFSKLVVFLSVTSSTTGNFIDGLGLVNGDAVLARPVAAEPEPSSSSHVHGYGSTLVEDRSTTEGSPVLPSLMSSGEVVVNITATSTVTVVPIPSGTAFVLSSDTVVVNATATSTVTVVPIPSGTGTGFGFNSSAIMGTGTGTGLMGTAAMESETGLPSLNSTTTVVAAPSETAFTEPRGNIFTTTVTLLPNASTSVASVEQTPLTCGMPTLSAGCAAVSTIVQTTTIELTTTVCIFAPSASGLSTRETVAAPSVSYSSILPPGSVLLTTGISSTPLPTGTGGIASASMPAWANSTNSCSTDLLCSMEVETTVLLTSTRVETETTTSTSFLDLATTEGSPNLPSGLVASGSSGMPVATNGTGFSSPTPSPPVYSNTGVRTLVSIFAVLFTAIIVVAL